MTAGRQARRAVTFGAEHDNGRPDIAKVNFATVGHLGPARGQIVADE
jgi:hypothetical protein